MNKAYMAALPGESRENEEKLKSELPAWMAPVGISADILLQEMKVNAQSYKLLHLFKRRHPVSWIVL